MVEDDEVLSRDRIPGFVRPRGHGAPGRTAPGSSAAARLAGVPVWSDRSGNHTWVEVWCEDDRKWHYIGASEPGPLDSTWFSGKAAQASSDHPHTAVYALSFRQTGTLFPCVWLPDNDYVWGIDVTQRYKGTLASG